MTPPRRDRALRRLLLDDGRLLPIDGDYFGVFPRGDGRRRVTTRLSSDDVRALVSDGAVAAQGDGYAITDAGVARARRSLETDDRFRRQHQRRGRRVVTDSDGDFVEKDVDLGHSPLRTLECRFGGRLRAPLPTRARLAGERLCADVERASVGPRVTQDWASPPGEGRHRSARVSGGMSDAARGAHQRVSEALHALGSGLDDVVKAVCLEGRSLTSVEEAFGWPRRSARTVLEIALERLADHYGLPALD